MMCVHSSNVTAGTCVCMCMQRTETDIKWLPLLSTLYTEARSLAEPHLAAMANMVDNLLQEIPVLTSHTTEQPRRGTGRTSLGMTQCLPGFYTSTGDLNLGLHAYMASTLPIEPPPHLHFVVSTYDCDFIGCDHHFLL